MSGEDDMINEGGPVTPEAEEEAAATHEGVDRHDWGPTEADEELVLAEMYGPPDAEGLYKGEHRG